MKALLYNIIPLHWKGLRETIGEDGDDIVIVIVKRRVGGCCCVGFDLEVFTFLLIFHR